MRFIEVILSTSYWQLLLSLLFFGLSVLIDYFSHQWISPWRIFFEDGFKLLGIVGWSGYLVHTAYWAIAPHNQLGLALPKEQV